MPRCRDPSRAMHVHADVVVASQLAVAGVEPHADLDRHAVRPPGGCERALCVDGRAHRVGGRGEDGKEGVALGRHLLPVMSTARAPQDRVVRAKCLAEAGAELLDEAGRAFNIGEQEGDRSDRQ